MAITRIRGGQIQDRTIDGVKLKQLTLSNEHIAANAAIEESKLAIDWAAHKEILENKKVLDYVQIPEQTVGGLVKFDATALIGDITPAALSSNTVEGVLTDAPKNVVIVRDTVAGDPIVNSLGNEIYGRMIYTPAVPPTTEGGTDGVLAKYEIAFFEIDATDAEVAFLMPAGQKAEFQYLRRFNLSTVDEMFAANEKFVDGSADTNARLDLQQLAKDLYGTSWTLDHDGVANLTRSLVDEIAAQTSGVTNTNVRASAIIDEVVAGRSTFGSLDARFNDIEGNVADVESELSTARGGQASLDARLDAMDIKNAAQDTAISDEATARANADTAIRTDLASTDATAAGDGKGAEMIGVRDVAGKFVAENVEGVLAEIDTALDAEVTRATGVEGQLQTNLTAEVTRATDAEEVLTQAVADEKARAEAAENALDGRVDVLEARVQEDVSDAIAVETARATAAEAKIVTDLADTAAGKGASTVAIEDAGGNFTAVNVEAALAELYTKIENDAVAGLESAVAEGNLKTKELESVGVSFGGQVTPQAGMVLDVPAAIVYNAEGKRLQTVASTVTIGAADATNPRIDVVYVDSLGVVKVAQGAAGAIPAVPTLPVGAVKFAEVSVPVNATNLTAAEVADKRVFVATGSEVQAARGSKASLDARLSVAINPDGTLKAGGQVHDHKKYIEQITVQTSVINMPTNEFFQNDGTLNVYVNGIFQANGVNFTEVLDVNSKGIGIDFGTDPVLIGDVVVLTYVNNNTN